jgi:hypothetical protein
MEFNVLLEEYNEEAGNRTINRLLGEVFIKSRESHVMVNVKN